MVDPYAYPEVFPGICITELRRARCTEALAEHGYGAILNLSETDYVRECPRTIRYHWHPLEDSDACMPAHFIEAAERLHQLVTAGHRTVVHCLAGISRSPSVVAAYVVRHRPRELAELWQACAARELPREFAFCHGFLDAKSLAQDEGFPPQLLDDPVFRQVAAAFKSMSFARPEIYLRPEMWAALYPEIRGYLAGDPGMRRSRR